MLSKAKPLSVLLVEDNPGEALLLSTQAEDFAHQPLLLEVTSTLEEARAAASERHFDVVLLDLGLPDSQGLATLQQMIEAAPGAPVVVLTGDDDRELARACLANGAEDYALKGQVEPFIGWILHNAVTRFASRKRLEHLNRVLEGLRAINQLVVRANDPITLVERACELLVDKRGYDGVGVLLEIDRGARDDRPEWRTAGQGDVFRSFAERAAIGWRPACHRQAAGASGQPEGSTVPPPAECCADCPLGQLHVAGASACVLVRHRERFFGSMAVTVPPGIVVDDEERALLLEIGGDLALGLSSIEGERRRAEGERRLRESERLLADTGRVARVGGWSYEVPTRQLAWTAMTREIHEVGEDFDPALNDAIAFYHPEDRPKLEAALTAAAQKGEPFDLELRFTTAKGRELWVQARCTPGLDDDRVARLDGRVARLVGTFQDITARKEAELQQAELEAQLRQSQRMEAIGQLAGGVAHDFNNLLTVINSYADLVEERLPEDDPLRAKVRQIGDAGGRAAGLTRQLLAFSRKQLLEPKRLDLGEVITNVQRLLRRLIGEDVAIELELQPGLWPIHADPGQIEQVLMNLAVNARDAMPRGGTLRLTTENRRLDRASAPAALDPGDYVVLTARDTGTGMTEEIRARIFEPFFTTKEEGRGTGLGLATVFGIVKQSGGEVQVESAPGQGATFRIFLPRAETSEGREARAPAEPGSSLGGSETILVVEDEAVVRELVSRILSREGYQVLTAANGRDALRTCRRHGEMIALVLTDIVMPQMSGKELVDKLAADAPQLKALFMSGYAGDVIARHGAPAPGAQLIRKPFRGAALLAKVREVLDT